MNLDNAFVGVSREGLREFLCEALKHGYGSSNTPQPTERGGLRQTFAAGHWSYKDIWYGGEPYSGITTVAYHGKVCWTMTYWGKVFPGVDKHRAYGYLIPALQHFDPELPVRGRKIWMAPDGVAYLNRLHGDLREFRGHEFIMLRDVERYQLRDISGLYAGIEQEMADAFYNDGPGVEKLFETRYQGGYVDLR